MTQDNSENRVDNKVNEDSARHDDGCCSTGGGTGCCGKGGAGVTRFFWIFLIILLAMVYFRSNQPLHIPENWSADLLASEKIAAQDNKNILVAFHTSRCIYCTKMKDEVYSTDKFNKYATENLVLVMLDGDTEIQAVAEYGITGYPSYIIKSPEGKVIKSFSGYMPTDFFISEISSAGK